MDSGDVSSLVSEQVCQFGIPDVIRRFQTDSERGLDDVEVARRLRMYGPNEMVAKEKETLLRKYIDQFKEPLILLLLGSAFVSTVMGQYDDAISITLAILIVVSVAFIQEYRSEESLKELNKLVPHTCRVVRGGITMDVRANDIVPGDIISFNVGDRIAADARLFEAVELEVDESTLTGETTPRSKNTDACLPESSANLADRLCMVYLGTLVRAGRGKAIVTGTANLSEIGIVFSLIEEVEEKRTPMQKRMDELGQKLSYFSFAIIGIIMVIGLLQKRNMMQMFTIGVSLAVAAIPEGLPIVVTVTLALGVIRMAKRKAIVKKLPAVEALGCATVICSDKTGTLTENQMTVTKIYCHSLGGVVATVSGTGYRFDGNITVDGMVVSTDVATHPSIAETLLIANLCNNAQVHNGEVIGTPTEGALLVAARKYGYEDQRQVYTRKYEVPFSSDAKFMAVRCVSKGRNDKETTYIKGAPDRVMARCKFVFQENGQSRVLQPLDIDDILAVAHRFGSDGLRVIATAEGAGTSQDDLTFVGLVAVIDPPRRGVRESCVELARSGVIVCVITGDMKETAEAIAAHLGIFDRLNHVSLSGADLDRLTAVELEQVIGTVRVFYRTTPRHKLSIVQAFQNLGHVVAMTGDGVNDAPALKMADIGVAMGKSGTDVAKEAASMILVDDNFSTILAAIEEGKGIAYNIRNFLRFQLSTSVAALSLIAIATMLGFPNPMNAMQILWINILMDGPPAQSLGVEPVDPDVMKKPPQKVQENIITPALIANVLISAVIIVTGTLFVYWKESSEDGVITARDTTMTFTTFVCFDMFNALSCRSQEKSVFAIGLFSNSVFLWAVGGSLFGQLLVIYFPPLQRVFQTESLYFSDILFILCMTSSVFIVDEIRKLLRRRRARR